MERIDLSETEVSPKVLKLIPGPIARMYSIVPVKLSNYRAPGEKRYALEVAVQEEVTMGQFADLQDEMDFVLKRQIIPAYVAKSDEIKEAIQRLYGDSAISIPSTSYP